jgi:Kef-type K+ transport system membrane component KefB
MLDPARLAAMAVELGINHFGRRESRSTTSIVLVAVATVSAGASACFALAALFIYLAPIVGAASAALAVAGCLLAVTAVALLARYYGMRRPQAGAPAPPDLQALAAGAESFVRDHKALVLAGAFVAGLLVSEEQRPRSRACPD